MGSLHLKQVKKQLYKNYMEILDMNTQLKKKTVKIFEEKSDSKNKELGLEKDNRRMIFVRTQVA